MSAQSQSRPKSRACGLPPMSSSNRAGSQGNLMRRVMTAGVALSGLLTLGATAPAPELIEPGFEIYPADARAQMIEGDVPVNLAVDVDGKVRCSAGGGPSLGSLRRASCELVVRRNIFGLRTVEGKTVPTAYDFLVRWRRGADNGQFGGAVPIGRAGWITYADYPAIARRQMLTGRVTLSFEVSEQGLVENCKIARSNTTNALAGAMCPLFSSRAIFLPSTDQDGRPHRAIGSFITDWRWCDSSRWQSCPPPDRPKQAITIPEKPSALSAAGLGIHPRGQVG
jgi:TonB family protein